MAFDELQPDPVIARSSEQYRKGMKELGRALMALAGLQIALVLLLVKNRAEAGLIGLLSFAAVMHLGMGVLIFREHFWVNYAAIVWAALGIVLNLVGTVQHAGESPGGG